MKNIFVITHAESIHHVEEKVGGWYDTGLTDRGSQQAERVANRLMTGFGIENPVITSSDLLRAKETAAIIAQSFRCDCQFNSDLREMSYGVAEGMPQQWLDARIVAAPDDNRLEHRVVEGGESKVEFIARVYRGMDAVIENDNPNHIIVTHGFAFTFVISRWIGLPAESAGVVHFRASACGITHLQQDDFWRNRGVRLLNDVAHLSV